MKPFPHPSMALAQASELVCIDSWCLWLVIGVCLFANRHGPGVWHHGNSKKSSGCQGPLSAYVERGKCKCEWMYEWSSFNERKSTHSSCVNIYVFYFSFQHTSPSVSIVICCLIRQQPICLLLDFSLKRERFFDAREEFAIFALILIASIYEICFNKNSFHERKEHVRTFTAIVHVDTHLVCAVPIVLMLVRLTREKKNHFAMSV